MTDRELMQDALDALESSRVFVTSREKIKHPEGTEWYDERIEALRARLAQPEPAECDGGKCGIGGYCKQCPKTQPDVPETAFGEIKPVAWKMKGVPAFATSRPNDTDSIKWDALYTAPPQREWVGLTDGEREQIEIKANDKSEMTAWEYAHRVGNFTEAKLKEKNT